MVSFDGWLSWLSIIHLVVAMVANADGGAAYNVAVFTLLLLTQRFKLTQQLMLTQHNQGLWLELSLVAGSLLLDIIVLSVFGSAGFHNPTHTATGRLTITCKVFTIINLALKPVTVYCLYLTARSGKHSLGNTPEAFADQGASDSTIAAS
eukprot:m.42130 g.42130  ORF g.42130 m.42130 type:complete len:150 (+) comp10651_c0_seq1:155-604(+)